jgi:DNA-binding transcriptional MerR regulator
MVETLLMTSDAARLLGRSAESVRVYERSGKLPAIKTTKGRRLFKESDVRDLAAKLAEKNHRREHEGATSTHRNHSMAARPGR